MSYAAHKSRLFRDAGDSPEVVRKRSEGRMKTYPSATDARAWCGDYEDRRQHILDLIRADHEKCALGKYVPIEVLIDTLLANKNADIARLRQQVEELQALLNMYLQLELTEEQLQKLSGMQKGMEKAGDELNELEERAGSKIKSPLEGEETGDETETAGGEIGESGTESEAAKAGEGDEVELAQAELDEETGSAAEDDTKFDTASSASKASRCAARNRAEESASKESSAAASQPPAVSYDNLDEKDMKALLISKDAEIISLKNAFAAKQAECDQQNKIARSAIEQLENLKNIMEERDILKQQLEDSLHEIQTLKSRFEDPCVAEIAALEAEIDRLRGDNDQLSPEDEAEIIRKEIDVLKKYCAKLSSIQEENSRLKTQLDRLQEMSAVPLDADDSNMPDDPTELKNQLRELRAKFAKLNEIIEERDRYKVRLKQLEEELSKYGDLPEEIEMFKQKSQILDDVLSERDNLQKRLENVKGMEEELTLLKKKADRVDELERLLDSANLEVGQIRRASVAEAQALKSQKDESSRELDSVKSERDMLKMRLADLATIEEEVERLRYRAKEAEVLRIERDRMKIRLDELAAIEVEYMQLLDKMRCFETIKAEREMYKQKYEELLGLECECDILRAQVERYKQLDKERETLQRQVLDCECCIADQEDEIKRLVTHIDHLSQGSQEQQDRMQKALTEMRVELEQKTSLITNSEEQLAGVQDQLKNTIAGVSCETSCLRARIEELESEIDMLHKQLATAKSELETRSKSLEAVSKNLEESNAHLASAHKMMEEKQKEVESLKEEFQEKDKIIHAERQSSIELKNACQNKDSLIAQLQIELDQAREKIQDLQNMTNPDKGMGSDDHLEKMLQQSKCAVQKVAEELGRHYQEWDCMQGRVPEEDLDYDPDLFTKYAEEKRTSLKLSNDVQELQAKIRELDEQLARANAIVAQLREELGATDRLSAENKALRRHSTEVQEVAKEQIEELAEHLKKANARIAELEAENSKLKEGIVPEGVSPQGDNCDELKQQAEALQSERNRLDALVQQLQADLSGSSPDVAELRMEIADLNEQIQKEIARRKELESENEKLKNLVDQMKADLAGGAPDLGALRAELADLQEQLQKEAKLRSAAEANLSTAEERIGNLTKELNSMTDSIQEKVRRGSIAESELQAELIKLRAENDQLKENLKSLGDNAARRTSQVQGEVEVIAEQNKQLLKDKLALESENASLKQQLENLLGAAGDTAELDALRRERDELLAQIEGQKKEIQDMLDKLNASAAGAAVDINKEQLEKERKEKEDLQNMIKNLQDQISGMEQGAPAIIPSMASDSSAINEAIAKLTAQLEQEQAKAAAAEAALKKLQEESGVVVPVSPVSPGATDDSSQLLSEIEALKAKIKSLEDENATLKASASGDNSQLLNEIEVLKDKIKTLEDENATLKASASGDNTALLDEIASLKNRIKDLEQQNAQLPSAPSGDNKAALDEINALKSRIKELEKEAGEAAMMREELEMVKNQCKDLEVQNEQLAAAAAGDDTILLKQLEDFKQKIKALEAENAELKGEISKMNMEMSGLERKSKDLQSLQGNEERIKELEAQLALEKQQCKDTIASLKAQYDKDAKSMNGKYNDGIAKLQGSHEEILKDVSKEYEREVEGLRSELRSSKELIETLEKQRSRERKSSGQSTEKADKSALSIKTIENVDIKPSDEKDVCTCRKTAFTNILQKILKQGIESLTFEELQYLHAKTCDATAIVLGKLPGLGAPPVLAPVPRRRTLDEVEAPREDKIGLLKHIGGLESDLIRKQKHAQQKVGALQVAVRMEKERLEDLKRNLEKEKQRNCELMCKIGAQSRAVANMQVERDMMRKRSSLHEEKLQELMISVEEEKNRVRRLEDDLQRAKHKQKVDSEALECMRVKLEKSLNNEMVLKMQLSQRTKGQSPPKTQRCICQQPAEPEQDKSSPPELHQTSTFYTELTIQDIKNKRNFVHHCCMKSRDRLRSSGERKRSSSAQPSSSRASSENDD